TRVADRDRAFPDVEAERAVEPFQSRGNPDRVSGAVELGHANAFIDEYVPVDGIDRHSPRGIRVELFEPFARFGVDLGGSFALGGAAAVDDVDLVVGDRHTLGFGRVFGDEHDVCEFAVGVVDDHRTRRVHRDVQVPGGGVDADTAGEERF